MIAIRLPSLRRFTSQLFVQDTFHPFLVYEASFITGCSFTVDGTRNAEYYGPDAEQNPEPYIFWEELRPTCYQIIRGTRLPLQFKLVFRAPQKLTAHLLQNAETTLTPEQVEALHFIVQYRNGGITCTTGTSLKLFTMDKTVDKLWDRWILQFLEQHQIENQYL